MSFEIQSTSDPARHPLVRALLEQRVPDRPVDLAIHPEDEMLLYGLELHGGNLDRALVQYFDSGLNIILSLKQVAEWRFGGFDAVGRVLDFASGYGRATRFLVAEIPPEKVTICDLYTEGVRFQERHFGVKGIVSTDDPLALPIDDSFDLINVTSLFTHLPAPAFRAWLARLLSLLTPRGVLCFTVHDRSLLENESARRSSDFLFVPQSESLSLDPERYGSTWVHESFVRAAVKEIDPKLSLLRIPRAIDDYQDLYLLAIEPEPRFSSLRFDGGCSGFIEGCERTASNAFRIHGWAIDRYGFSVESIEILVNGQHVAATSDFWPRTDVAGFFQSDEFLRSGWECNFEGRLPRSDSFDVCTIKAISSSGAETILALDTVAGLELNSAKILLDKAGYRSEQSGPATKFPERRIEGERAREHQVRRSVGDRVRTLLRSFRDRLRRASDLDR